MQIIVAFKSRTDTMKYSDILRQRGVPTVMINTPRELAVGCGISVSVDEKYADVCRNALKTSGYMKSYIGTYKIIRQGTKTLVMPYN